MNTATNPTNPETAHSSAAKPRRRVSRPLASLLSTAIIALGVIAPIVTTPTASAASNSTPTISCVDGGVRVEPNISSGWGQTDGYYRITLFRTNRYGAQLVARSEARVSASLAKVPGPVFYGYGTGNFQAVVERWNAVNGRWVALQDSWAYAMSYGYVTTTPGCNL